MRRTFFLSFIVLISLSMISFAQEEREAEARKLYLEASRLARAEDYKPAESILNIILSDYIDTEIALKADELLNSITDKLKAQALPKTPGFYVLLKNGDLVQLEKLVLKKGTYLGNYISYTAFKQENVTEIYADELAGFYIYHPKADLSQIKCSSFNKEEVPEGGMPTDNWIIVDSWYVQTEQGRFASGDIVFEEVKTGLFKISFSNNFSPINATGAALLDGSPYCGIVIIQPKMSSSLYPLMKYWNPGQIQASQEIVKPLLQRYPEKPEVHLISGVITYKQGYDYPWGPVRAKKAALAGIKATTTAPNTPPQVIEHLKALLNQCLIDSVITANLISGNETKEQLSDKISALNRFEWWAEKNAHYHWYEAKAAILGQLGYYEMALKMCDRALEQFKLYGEKGTSLFGTKLSVTTGREQITGFQIQTALNNYAGNYKKKTEKLRKYIESEQILAQVERDYIDGTGSPKDGLKLVDKARKKDKNNEHVYLLRAALYEKLGDEKNRRKALNEVEKIRKEKEKK